MSNDKTDRIIREKMEILDGVPGSGQFDHKKSWKRMEYRLVQMKSRQSGWWKYAAAVLLFFCGAYGLYHYQQRRIIKENISQTKITKSPAVNISGQNRSQNNKNVPAKNKKEIILKRKKNEKRERSERSVAKTKKPTENQKEDTLLTQMIASETSIKPDTINFNQAVKGSITFKRESPDQEKLPIVYYNEIMSSQNKKTIKKEEPVKLLSPVFKSGHVQNVLATNEQYLIDYLKINITRKNNKR